VGWMDKTDRDVEVILDPLRQRAYAGAITPHGVLTRVAEYLDSRAVYADKYCADLIRDSIKTTSWRDPSEDKKIDDALQTVREIQMLSESGSGGPDDMRNLLSQLKAELTNLRNHKSKKNYSL